MAYQPSEQGNIVITKYLFSNLPVSDRREELKQNIGSSVCFRLLISGGLACRCGDNDMKMKLIVLGIVVGLILIIILSIFQGICGK